MNNMPFWPIWRDRCYKVQYPDLVADTVVVKKKNGKDRVWIDFTYLNKACPNDSFPLPHIDCLVESTAGNELLTFMDAFSSYNQIMMNPEDQEKTSFITDRGICCYKVMPFGFKNTGATYQRLVNKMFHEHLGKTMEVYIDDMLVKSLKKEDHVKHLEECFEILNQYQMKLNPAKCTFGVPSGEFLGENTIADALAVMASTSDPDIKRVIPVECISERSFKKEKETLVITKSRAATRDHDELEIELQPVKRRKSKGSTVSDPGAPKESSSEEPINLIEDVVP
ncbi:hypothetical protein AXX17_AT4G08320 [Arabidopsis thaliana]|uniref:Reverse transcriptase domain-containing protein n=1 Tax=Arabidopsis thaliana TaxID=3702 RepID=A0A178UTV8_ARATH|nr:hypothetical protein AXX17_AT4G08320 [Arabidopsis thaliana]